MNPELIKAIRLGVMRTYLQGERSADKFGNCKFNNEKGYSCSIQLIFPSVELSDLVSFAHPLNQGLILNAYNIDPLSHLDLLKELQDAHDNEEWQTPTEYLRLANDVLIKHNIKPATIDECEALRSE